MESSLMLMGLQTLLTQHLLQPPVASSCLSSSLPRTAARVDHKILLSSSSSRRSSLQKAYGTHKKICHSSLCSHVSM